MLVQCHSSMLSVSHIWYTGIGLRQPLTAWYLTWGFLLKEKIPSGSSSSDLSAMSLDVSFKDLSGVLGTVGSGSGVVCEGEGEGRRGGRKGGRRRRGREGRERGEGERGGREGREGGGRKGGRRGERREKRERKGSVKQHYHMAVAASQAYSLLCPIWELHPPKAMVAPKKFILHVHTSDQKKVIMYHFLTVLPQLLMLILYTLSQVWWCNVVKYFCAHYR